MIENRLLFCWIFYLNKCERAPWSTWSSALDTARQPGISSKTVETVRVETYGSHVTVQDLELRFSKAQSIPDKLKGFWEHLLRVVETGLDLYSYSLCWVFFNLCLLYLVLSFMWFYKVFEIVSTYYYFLQE